MTTRNAARTIPVADVFRYSQIAAKEVGVGDALLPESSEVPLHQ
jgi:hypothetical protein